MANMALNLVGYPESSCNEYYSNKHTLDCEHTIISPPNLDNSACEQLFNCPPDSPLFCTPASPKLPCSPNCTRNIYVAKPQLPLSWLKPDENLHTYPFICPVCIEDQIRAQYPKFLAQHKEKYGRPSENTDSNVQLWTYAAVLDAVDRGGRLCEATTGVFRLKYVNGFKCIVENMMAGKQATWKMRDGEVDAEEDAAAPKWDLDVEDASTDALVARNEGEGGDVEMDDLAGWLKDAKVGLDEGPDGMDGLMEGISKL
ncbi:hypothetical protein BDW02DRAFT_624368 [Decorospora gaudefroyi]|uniref:Uncharacterized protein n=1 Tax=Decorospora gaudefroyi TaxID=184978 RepID=A0A6A5KF25_9PLEO|nr:hypothetical protein BDW02DRAFT_624368 [Decorospora gaudefroyi]